MAYDDWTHLNFGTINDLTKLDLVDGLPKFKYGKDHLCSACERGKSKKASHPPKLIPSDYSKLELLHMDLCGPMRVASVNGKKYILVIVDDFFSRFTWVYFLRSKDETPEIIKKFIAQAQLNYKAKVCKIRTDNGTEFKNATLKAYYEKLESDEFNQEDSADFDGNTQFVPYDSLNHEEIESSTTNLEPSNVQNFHQVQHLDSQLEIVHPLRPSIGDPIQTCYDSSTANYDSELCICTLDLYGKLLAYFERRRIKHDSLLKLFTGDRKELTLTLDDFRIIFHLPAKQMITIMLPLTEVMQRYSHVLDYLCYGNGTQPHLQIMKCYSALSITLCGLCGVNRGMAFTISLHHPCSRCLILIFQDDDIMRMSSFRKKKQEPSLAEQKGREEQEARENVALVYEHLAAKEIEKLVEDYKNVDDSSPPRHDDTSIPGTRLEPRSDKESPEVEIVQEKEEETTLMVDVTNIVIPVNVDDEEDEITDEVFELRRRAKGKNVEETRISPIPSPTRSPRNLSTLVSSDTEKLQELTVTHPTPSSGSFAPKLTKTNRLLSLIKAKPNRFKRYKSFFHELQGRYGYLFAHLKKRFMPRTSSDQLADNLHDVMMERLTSIATRESNGASRWKFRTSSRSRSCHAHISSQIQNAIDNAIPSLVDASVRSYMSGHILHVHPA
ncbi:retrovirus-related pol polyprotein from transposon TNT 1-94 [Tanacetum coccineum]|uniref:Retrovirus-related pol polyprotein from transposon TNT 1-94 n=1 Tax=Tanacetum coccineum TaxID=301880 RepID=A0ABQ5JCG0_9ASTR